MTVRSIAHRYTVNNHILILILTGNARVLFGTFSTSRVNVFDYFEEAVSE